MHAAVIAREARPLRFPYSPYCSGCANNSKMQGFERSVMVHCWCCIFTSANYSIHFNTMAQHP